MENQNRAAGADLEQVTDHIEEGIRSGKYTWREIQSAVVAKTREAATTTDHYAHENPWRVIGIAAAFGLVLGLLCTPRSFDE
jgi:ElaB/YqjD/DUF883 family membrane-anchored ribosome-binding protein